MMRIVGGIDAGDKEAPPVWDDAGNGSVRVLRALMNEADRLAGVVVIGFYRDNRDLYIASNLNGAETVIGYLERAKVKLAAFAEEFVDEDQGPGGAA